MRFLVTFSLLFSFTALSAQFSSPESVEYDAANNRWLVGNNGNGTISAYYPATATVVPFASGLASGPHGLEILGNTLYACDGGRIKGFDLTTGTQVFNLNLSASFLNGLTTDGVNYLFATDFSAKKIYRVTPATSTFNLMVTTLKTPNGIYYDGANNRCVFVTWGTAAPIQAMSLADSVVTTLTATTLNNCDGITRDNAGYWYVTAWSNNALNRFDPGFTGQTNVMGSLSSPADIDINAAGDSIGIPNSGGSTVVFYTNITTGIATVNSATEISVFPNPANGAVQLLLSKPVSKGTCTVTDASGKIVDTVSFTGTQLIIERKKNAAGIYLVSVADANGEIVTTTRISWMD
jgi:hypothetical protein